MLNLVCSFSSQPGSDLYSRVEAELGQDVMDVVVHGALGEVQALCDLAVAHALREELRHLVLAAAECRRDQRTLRLGRSTLGLVATCRVQAPRPRQAGELARAAFGNLQAGADDEVLDGAGDEHLARLRSRHHAGGDMQGVAAVLAARDLAFARM